MYIHVYTHTHTYFPPTFFLSFLLACCLCPHCRQYNSCLETVFFFVARLKKTKLSRSCSLFLLFFFSIFLLLHKRGKVSRVWGSTVCWLPVCRFCFRRHFLDTELRLMRKSASKASRFSEELLRKKKSQISGSPHAASNNSAFFFFLHSKPLRRNSQP